MRKWRNLSYKIENLTKVVKIVLVGKYTKLEDSYASITKALQHAAVKARYKLNVEVIKFYLNEKIISFSI